LLSTGGRFRFTSRHHLHADRLELKTITLAGWGDSRPAKCGSLNRY
jgi:hypothetical protein